jgi:hypothetical protein
MLPFLGKVAAAVASNVLTSKILGTDEQKSPIGTGQSAGIQAGPPLEIDPIEGSSVDEFGEFDTENFAESAQNEQDRLMELVLMEQMKDDEGIASLYSGGYVQKAAFGDLIGDIDLSLEGMDMSVEAPEAPEATPFANITKWFESLDPEVQDALMEGAEDVGIAAFTRIVSGKQPRPGGRVKTPEAGGFQNKRQMQKIKPIQGSSFADGGAVLNRKMFAQNFMPDGGKIKGPGGPKDDLIPVMASNGEYMLSKAAVDQAGGGNHAKGVAALEAFNALGNMRYG